MRFPRTIQILSLFLPFLKVGKSKNEPLSLMTTKMLLVLRVNPQVLENLRDPLKRRLALKLPHRHSLLLLLFLQRTKGRGLMSKIPAPPKPKKLLLHVGRQLSIHTLTPSSVRNGDEEEMPAIDATARTSTSHTLVVSEVQVEGEESSPPQQNTDAPTPPASPLVPSPKRGRIETITEPTLQLGSSSTPLLDDPLIKEFIRFGAQFVGYREYASKAEEKLAEANKRADTLAQKLEQSEEARKKAESDASKARAEADKAKADAAGVEELQKRLHDAETSLSEHIAAQSAREDAIIKRLKSQNRRFVSKTSQEYELEDPDNDPLLDALAFLEFHGEEARDGIDQAKDGLSRLFPYFFPKKKETATFLALAKCFNPPEDLGLKLRQENMKVAVESTVTLVADSQQNIDWTKVGDTQEMETTKWQSLIRAAKPNTKKILAYLGFKPTPAPSSSKPEV
ncbi:hypothetical protein QYE76_046985 [Lolium multiflorum]|uniref:FRIGIDA-like protein n=1 Tax=Lolium multiflorum TaxID=4521 RepID=A0AAD8TQV8_LOLMU|nr:hypothetical protein QYE76_046985 [Lolium multiflorum]